MALSTPTIKYCKLRMDVQPSTVNLINEYLPIDIGVYFNAITSLEVVSGSYLPANNTLDLAPSIPSNLAPNFVILITDGPANITLKSGATVLALQNPMNKVYFNAMVANTTYLITDIILDGTTAALVPMSQTTTVNYTLIYGIGIVS